MKGCGKARGLFGAYWDDETTRAEREWLDAHFTACAGCRAEYEALARTLSAVAALPREDAAPDLAARSLAAARRAAPVRDVVFVRETPRWVPAGVAAAAAFALVLGLAPMWMRAHAPAGVANRGAVVEPRLVAAAAPARREAAPAHPRDGAVAVISDSLFDHSADVDFVLDPVTLHRGRAHTASRLGDRPKDGEAIITF